MSTQQPQSQPAGKKGKKKKGTTVSLTDFLGDSAPAPVAKNIDWADEADDFDGSDLTYQSSYNNKKILSSLPTGPRASRTIEVDMSKLPNEPPFTAFVGNLPYEADEEMLADFFKDLKILSVRLPEENGRFKGYGYVEFEDRHSLAQALQHNEETFNKRQIRVDVAGSKNQDGRRGSSRYGNQGFGMGGGGFDGPDVTEGDWRRKPNEDFRPPQSNRGYGESDYRSDQRGYYQEDRRYGDRDSYGQRDYGRYDSGYRQQNYRDYQRSDSYGRDDRYGSGGGHDYDRGGYRDERGYVDDRGGYRDDRGYSGSRYGGDRGYNRDRGYGDRGYDRGGYGRDRDYGGDRSYGGSRGYGGDRDRGYYNRGGGYRDDYGSRDGDYGRDRYQDNRRDVYDRSYRGDDDSRWRNQDSYSSQGPERRRSNEGGDEPPPSRPTLNLKPRTKPLEEDKAETTRSSSIFGSAKPVDTAAREKEIEEKIKKEEENVFHVKDERSDYKRAPRRSSERSDDGGHQTSPRRHPRRISSDKDYKDSHRRRSTSPGHQQDENTSKDKPSQRDYKPAPPPKQSAWGKRSSTDKDPRDDRGAPRKPSASDENVENKKPVVKPAPPPTANPWSRGPPKIDTRGEREEAEGNARDDGLNERTPEGSDDVSRNGNGSAGDGSDQRRDSDRQRQNDKPRPHGDGRRDDQSGRGKPTPRRSYEDESDYRRRGDGGSGKRRDGPWDQNRSNYDNRGPARNRDNYKRPDNRKREENNSRGESGKSTSGQEKKRDSSRDSRPECDRSAAAGQEQDFHKGSKSGRRPRGPVELEPEPTIEFVQKSKFAALALDDDDDDEHASNGNEATNTVTE